MNFLAGIDNGVIFLTVLSCLLCFYFGWILYHNFRRLHPFHLAIHPENIQQVDEVRSQISRSRLNDETTNDSQDITCPICLESTVLMVETNCQHCYCGSCFCAYWHQNSTLTQPTCPVCRGALRFLIKHFTEREQTSDSSEKNEVDSQVNLFNRRFSGNSVSLLDQLRDLPVLLRHGLPSLLDGRGISLLLRVRLLILSFFVFFYMLSPMDFLPEYTIGIFGLLDDLIILFVFFLYMAALYRRHITLV